MATRLRRPLSAWDRAIRDFGTAWGLSACEQTALQVTLGNPPRRPDSLVRALLAEAGGLALERSEPDLAAWCYAACERVGTDADVLPDRALVERFTLAVAHGVPAESLVWWCVRLVPRRPDETPEAARERTTACALYLAIRVMQTFASDDARERERAGLVAVLTAVIARRLRDEELPSRPAHGHGDGGVGHTAGAGALRALKSDIDRS